jgi:hypothetical protein
MRKSSWRDHLTVHPAADLFPRMSDAELRALGEDIRKNGLTSLIAIIATEGENGRAYQLLDGRNRLDAMELVGITFKIGRSNGQCWLEIPDLEQQLYPARNVADRDTYADPYTYVISANIHRRHLTTEQKRELIAKLLTAAPNKSDRQIAKTVMASPTFAAKMKSIGLQPSSTGDVGGKETGQRVSHYIIPGGAFEKTFTKLAVTGWKLNLQSAARAGAKGGLNNSKTTFRCSCGQNAFGKPGLDVLCHPCVEAALAFEFGETEAAEALKALLTIVGAKQMKPDANEPIEAPPPIEPPPPPPVKKKPTTAKRKRPRPKSAKIKFSRGR